jgi:hypothetical protein
VQAESRTTPLSWEFLSKERAIGFGVRELFIELVGVDS